MKAQDVIDKMDDKTLRETTEVMSNRFPLDPNERIYEIDMHEWYDLLYEECDRRQPPVRLHGNALDNCSY